MGTPNNLIINNQYDAAVTLMFVVSTANWNCCDEPTVGTTVTGIPYRQTGTLVFCRKDGHGCNGGQGIFQLDVYDNGTRIGSQGFSFDSGGSIFLTEASGSFKMLLEPISGGVNCYVFEPAAQ